MHITIINRWPRFKSSSERWDNELTRYEDFIDHVQHKVSYIVDEQGQSGVLTDVSDIAALQVVKDVNDFSCVDAALGAIIEQNGPVDVLISLSEFNLEPAARLREKYNIPGPTPELVARYRDKVKMKECIRDAGIRYPKFQSADAPLCLEEIKHWRWPLVLKPRGGAASIGVQILLDIKQAQEAFTAIKLSDYQVEEFIEGDIYHIDGYLDSNGTMKFMAVSKYINDCLSFNAGLPLGSFIVGEGALRDEIEAFSVEVCHTLQLNSTPFHLELINHHSGLFFLEIGARVGGAEVPHLTNHLFGVNFFEWWLKELSSQSVIPFTKNPESDRYGGWLIVPKPSDACVKITQIKKMSLEFPEIWRELTPAVGDVIHPGGAYDALHVGRFIVTAHTAERVEEVIRQIINKFEYKYEIVERES